MANGLMAVMAVETALSFKAHIIMGLKLKPKASDVVVSDFDQWIKKKDNDGNIVTDSNGKQVLIRSSRAVGLLQFTQAVFEDIGLFKRGTGFDALHRAKLKFAQKGEIAQLDDVKNYLEKGKDKILKPEDIYIYVFAPDRIDMRNPDDVLYDKKTDGQKYSQNESVDVKEINQVQPDGSIKKVGDGKIVRKELLARYYKQYKEGKSEIFTSKCESFEEKVEKPKSTGEWHDPVNNPALNLYNSASRIKPKSSLFGKYRNRPSPHYGLDLFALPGTPIYACLDGKVVSNSDLKAGAGQFLVVQIDNTKDLLKQLNENYKCDDKEMEGCTIKESDTVYLGYMHIHPTTLVKVGDNVTCGQQLGYTSVTGFDDQLPSPHLHFEIRTRISCSGTGEKHRANPAKFLTLHEYDTPEQREAAKYIYRYKDNKIIIEDPKGKKRDNPKLK